MSQSSKSKVAFGQSSKRGAIPRTTGNQKSKSSVSTGGKSSKSCMRSSTARPGKFKMPALSVPPKVPAVDPVLERLRKKTIRRNVPPGEDLRKIRDIIKGLHNEVVTVQEYVGLISPYTGDNGNILHNVMGEDLGMFRGMAKRVYDTMTQDVSDVLANEQINLTDYYNEKFGLFSDKMMRAIDEIYRYFPGFDFDAFYRNRQKYLDRQFPLKTNVIDPEDQDMMRRQEAYHRLQWLRSEGTRLNEENDKLQGRLKELRMLQRDEMLKAKQQEEMAELRKNHLEATQEDLQNTLQDLDKSLDKSMVDNENMFLQENVIRPKKTQRPETKIRKGGEPWNVRAARDVESQGFSQTVSGTKSNISVASRSSKIKSKKRPPLSKHGKESSIRSQRQTSPFHYSPPKTPPRPMSSPTTDYFPNQSTACGGGGGGPRTTRVETTTTTVTEQVPPGRQLPPARRNLAPRDTWTGF